jgi:hypothetical protein
MIFGCRGEIRLTASRNSTQRGTPNVEAVVQHRRTLHATVSFRSLQGHAKSSVPLSSSYRPPVKGMRREKERERERGERI